MQVQSAVGVSSEDYDSVVDVVFPLTGPQAPADHGYLLYSALSRVLPEIHQSHWCAVHPLSGRIVGDALVLHKGSQLVLRVPAGRIPILLKLAGQRLSLGGDSLRVGAPSIRQVMPAAELKSLRVAIRLTEVPRRPDGVLDRIKMASLVEEELKRQLQALGVSAQVQMGRRLRLTVAGRAFVAWQVTLRGLSDDDSLVIQRRGLGGKRSMGCGVFAPCREPAVRRHQTTND